MREGFVASLILVLFACAGQAGAQPPVTPKPPAAVQAAPPPAITALERRADREKLAGKILMSVGPPIGLAGGIAAFYYLDQTVGDIGKPAAMGNADAISMWASLGVTCTGLVVVIAGIVTYAVGESSWVRAQRMRNRR